MQITETAQNKPVTIATLTFVSWLGAYIHTTLELQLPVWSPENSFPALVGLALYLAWWKQPRQRRLWTWLLLGWTAGAHLLTGAIFSVLPLPLWPFDPEQSVVHYLSHAIYAGAQLPLIGLLWQEIKR